MPLHKFRWLVDSNMRNKEMDIPNTILTVKTEVDALQRQENIVLHPSSICIRRTKSFKRRTAIFLVAFCLTAHLFHVNAVDSELCANHGPFHWDLDLGVALLLLRFVPPSHTLLQEHSHIQKFTNVIMEPLGLAYLRSGYSIGS